MKTIHKYSLANVDQQTIAIPKHAIPLCVQIQYGEPKLWMLVDDELEKEDRVIYIYGTGHQIPAHNQFSYIGTYQILSGDLVFHVFIE